MYMHRVIHREKTRKEGEETRRGGEDKRGKEEEEEEEYRCWGIERGSFPFEPNCTLLAARSSGRAALKGNGIDRVFWRVKMRRRKFFGPYFPFA